jgi:transposase-like protein
MKCPECTKGDVHAVGYGGGGEYACNSCGAEFYGKTMRDAITKWKDWKASCKTTHNIQCMKEAKKK